MIKSYVEKNGISYLCHFTKFSNLDSILENGITPRNELILRGTEFKYNDEIRLDGYMNASCLSISFPAYRMFYKYQCQNADIDWAIIRLKPQILWENDCAFSVTNAANNSVTSIPLEQKKGPNAFLKLFAEIKGKPTRQQLNIPSSFPTDPQAEVLVFGQIETDLIIDINIKSKSQLKEFDKILTTTQKYKNFAYYHNDPLFAPRLDWVHWKI